MPAVMDDFEAYGQLRQRPLVVGAPAPPPIELAPPPRKRSHWLRNSIAIILAYFVLAAATLVQPLAIPFTDVRLALPFPGGASLVFGLPNRPYTVLVIGLDRRPGETGASRTDTILLVRIDPRHDRAAYLSIPRDSMMQVPSPDGSWSRDRINTAYVYNYSSKDPSAAPDALRETIEHNLGIKVDHYVIFDHYNSKRVIDAMGGVDIDNPVAFGQDDYSEDDIHVVPQYFAQGRIHLDGYQAVAYGRIREGSTDFDRIQRQQRVAAALMDKAASPFSIFRMPATYRAYRGAVKTDMSVRQSAGVLAALKKVPDSRLKTRSLADAAVPCASCTASIQQLDADKAAAIIADAYGDAAAGTLAAQLLVSAGVTP